MKNETKLKIASVSAGFAVIALLVTLVLISIKHPAQWYIAGALVFSMCVAIFTICTID